LNYSETFMLIVTVLAVCMMLYFIIKKYKFRNLIYIMVLHSLVLFVTRVFVQGEVVLTAFLDSFGLIQLILFAVFLFMDYKQANTSS